MARQLQPVPSMQRDKRPVGTLGILVILLTLGTWTGGLAYAQLTPPAGDVGSRTGHPGAEMATARRQACGDDEPCGTRGAPWYAPEALASSSPASSSAPPRAPRTKWSFAERRGRPVKPRSPTT